MTRARSITVDERDAIFDALATETVAAVAAQFKRHPRGVGQLRTVRIRMGLPTATVAGRQEAYLRAVARRASKVARP